MKIRVKKSFYIIGKKKFLGIKGEFILIKKKKKLKNSKKLKKNS